MSSYRSSYKRIILILVVFISLSWLIACLIYPPEYIFRVLVWQEADVYDYQRFPERRLEISALPFYFDQKSDEDRIRGLFEPTAGIEDLDAFLVNTGTQAFIVIQNDRILYEKYFNGAKRETIVTSFSMAKSFTSALVGIAVEEGYISSIHDPITKYLPELANRDPNFSNITIRNLLIMSSGIRYVEFPFLQGDDTLTYYYPDLRQLALEHTRLIDPPGAYFLYNNYHPLLLGLILERTTQTSVAHYLQEKIWKPLGMEYPGSWSLDSQASGFEKMESGINARAIDFAKFGRLYLRNGNWNSNQIIPVEWVIESTQPDTSLDEATYYPDTSFFASKQSYYKYFWWGLRRGEDHYDFLARGNHGQFIYVSPNQDLIIVRNGERFGIEPLEWIEMFYEFANAIEPLS